MPGLGHWGDYQPGETSGTSLPVDYKPTGILIAPPKAGGQVMVWRLTGNGIAIRGADQSTEVTQVADEKFVTIALRFAPGP